MRINIKRFVSSILILVMLVGMTGCKSDDAKQMLVDIENGVIPVLAIPAPSTYKAQASNPNKSEIVWTQLDQVKTYNRGFRQEVDEIFNTNIIKDISGGIGGKQSCLFVKNIDGVDRYSGNTTLLDAFRNKRFIENYWENHQIQTKIGSFASDVYTDAGSKSTTTVQAALNAYFNLIGTADDKFDGHEAMTREEFYAFLVRATQPVHEIEENNAYMELSKVHIIKDEDGNSIETERVTADALLAGSVEGYNFINTSNNGLTAQLIDQHISRIEVIYMLVNMFFTEQLEQVPDRANGFSDTIYGGDIALKIGFKENSGSGVIEKPLWQLYTLSYMLSHTDKAMQAELYNALVVAKDLRLITDNASRWNEAIGKAEAIDLIIAVGYAQNKLYGYATNTEYAEMDSNIIDREEEVLEKDDNKILYDLASLPGELISVFTKIYDETDPSDYSSAAEMLYDQLDKIVELCKSSNIDIIEGYDLAFREWRKGMVKNSELRFRDADENIDASEYSTYEKLLEARIEYLVELYEKNNLTFTDTDREKFISWLRGVEGDIVADTEDTQDTQDTQDNTGGTVFDADGYEIDPATGKRIE